MRKYTATMLFRDFRRAYPQLWCRGCYYELSGHMQILIRIPNKGKVIYEYFGNKLTWIERWRTPEEERERKKTYRQNIYEDFLDDLNLIMFDRNLTQQDVADMSGISRMSINKYLGRRAIPKMSTMQQIADAVGFRV